MKKKKTKARRPHPLTLSDELLQYLMDMGFYIMQYPREYYGQGYIIGTQPFTKKIRNELLKAKGVTNQ